MGSCNKFMENCEYEVQRFLKALYNDNDVGYNSLSDDFFFDTAEKASKFLLALYAFDNKIQGEVHKFDRDTNNSIYYLIIRKE